MKITYRSLLWIVCVLPTLLSTSLIPAEAQIVVNDNATATNPPPDSCVSAPSGIVSWWRGEGNVSDAQNINAGILENGTTFGSGIVGQAFRFDGIDNFVRIDQHPSLRITNQLTIEFWMKPDLSNELNSYQGLVTSDFYGIEIANGYSRGPLGVEFFISTDGGASVSPSSFPDTATVNGGGAQISAGEWHHVAGTYDGSKLQLYIDGQPWGNPAYHSGLISPMLPDSFVTIGAEYGRTIWAQYNGPRYFNGLIDEPTIYNRALSPEEILAIYDAGSSGKCGPSTPPSSCMPAPGGLVGWWQGENNAVDSITGSSGILSGGVGFSSGEVGQAFEFDGVDDRMVISNSPSLNFDSGQDFSIEAWIQPLPSTTDYDVMSIVDKRLAPNLSQCLGYEFNLGAGRIHCRLSDSLSGNGISVGPAGPDLRDGNFHHVALSVTHVGTSGGKLYVDGQEVASFDAGGLGDLSNVEPLRIGNHASSFFNAFFKGRIDEVSLYSRGLSASEISAIYNAGADGKCPQSFVPQAPSFVSQPVSQTNYVGTSAGFTVQAIGDFPLHYQWLFENEAIPGQTNGTLLLSNVQPLNAGDYSVVITNSVGAITSAVAVLTIILPPPCAPPPSGLVSWWRFENNLLDNWGLNDGFSPAALVFASGKVGVGLNNSYGGVQVKDSPSLHLANALTLEAWINPNSYSRQMTQVIVAKAYTFNLDPITGLIPRLPYGNRESSFILGTTNGGQLFFAIRLPQSISTNVSVISPQIVPANQWSHVAATYDGMALNLYLNGSLAGSMSYSNRIAIGDGDLGIGGNPQRFVMDLPFVGLIDETSIYNRALSADEIRSIYRADYSGKCLMPPIITQQPLSQTGALGEDVQFSISIKGSRPFEYRWLFNETNIAAATNSSLVLENLASTGAGFYSVRISNPLGTVQSATAQLKLLEPPECILPPDGLVSWWPMDDSGLDVISGNNLQGPLSFVSGKVDSAITFDGYHREQVHAHGSNLKLSGGFSIEGWIRSEARNPSGRGLLPIFSLQADESVLIRSGFAGYSLGLANGRLAFNLITASWRVYPPYLPSFVSTGPDLRDGRFHHVALALNPAAAEGGVLYVDGLPLLKFTATNWSSYFNSSGNVSIGSGPTLLPEYSSFFGKIDELAIYSRPLTPAEIASISHAGRSGKCKMPPAIITQLTNQIVAQGSNTSFVVVATGTPTLKYQWLKQGVVVPGATNASLNFTNVQSLAAGLYSVRVTNAFGSTISSNATLTVEPLAIASSGGRLSYKQSGSQWDLKFTGIPGQTYKIQASTNLVDWTTIGTATDLGGGNFEFVDPDWKSRNTGFYRIVQP